MIVFNKERQFLPYVMQSASKYNVPPALILGHMRQESSFNPKTYRAEPQINDASTGLMQILLGTAIRMDTSATQQKLLIPEYNIDLGTRYIAQNLMRYNGNIKDAIAAYNAGSAMKNPAGQYVNTKGKTNVQSYVNKVYDNYVEYGKWLSVGSPTITASTINPFTIVTVGAIVLAMIVGGLVYGKKRKYN